MQLEIVYHLTLLGKNILPFYDAQLELLYIKI